MAQSLFENREQQQPMLRPHLVSLDGEPAFPTTPVLSLELGNISKMSKGGREGLSYMWTGALDYNEVNHLSVNSH